MRQGALWWADRQIKNDEHAKENIKECANSEGER